MQTVEDRIVSVLKEFFLLSPEIISAGIIRGDGRLTICTPKIFESKQLPDLMKALDLTNEIFLRMCEKGLSEFFFIEAEKRCIFLHRLSLHNHLLFLCNEKLNFGTLLFVGKEIIERLKDLLDFEKAVILSDALISVLQNIYETSRNLAKDSRKLFDKVQNISKSKCRGLLKLENDKINSEDFIAQIKNIPQEKRCTYVNKELIEFIKDFVKELKKELPMEVVATLATSTFLQAHLTLRSLVELYGIQVEEESLLDNKLEEGAGYDGIR
jgi:hypothetical protein